MHWLASLARAEPFGSSKARQGRPALPNVQTAEILTDLVSIQAARNSLLSGRFHHRFTSIARILGRISRSPSRNLNQFFQVIDAQFCLLVKSPFFRHGNG